MNVQELHRMLPDVIASQPCDHMQVHLRNVSDQQMRMVVEFSNLLNEDVLRKAVRLAIVAEPVLSCYFVADTSGARFQKHPVIDEELLFSFIVTAAYEKMVNQRLTTTVGPESNPIVQVSLVRSANKDTLCVNMNHVACDGTGLKSFVYLLSRIYTRLLDEPEFLPVPNFPSDRTIGQVLKHFTFWKKAIFFAKAIAYKRPSQYWTFQWAGDDGNQQSSFLHYTMPSDYLQQLKEFCRNSRITINDVIVAAYVRAMAVTMDSGNSSVKPIIVPVDLRKYILSNRPETLCNLSSVLVCDIPPDIGDRLSATASIIHQDMEYKKAQSAEFFVVMPFLVFSGFFGFKIMKKIAERIIRPPLPPLMSNVGSIDVANMQFKDAIISNAKILGTISHCGALCACASTFDEKLTIGIGIRGTQAHHDQVDELLKEFCRQLRSPR